MMNQRPFKFRIWDNLKKEWLKRKIYHASIRTDGDGIGDFEFRQHPQGYTIQQFTGLTDKYGKDIYEGDILKFSLAFAFSDEHSEFVEVKWNNKSGRWIVHMTGTDYFDSSYVSIVGNIFDDPDLLQLCSKN